MTPFMLKMCDIQGRLFELSDTKGLDSPSFMKTFMNGKVSQSLDSKYSHMQWAGEEYLLDEILEQSEIPSGKSFDKQRLYWCGYIYRYWHFLTGEDSRRIYMQAPAKVMEHSYLMLHTMDPALAVKELQAIHDQKRQI